MTKSFPAILLQSAIACCTIPSGFQASEPVESFFSGIPKRIMPGIPRFVISSISLFRDSLVCWNMPGSDAQRPGDIVTAYNGKTIEVLNTDAEGRLVLADALTFTEKKFKPKFIVDLATLTGAIIVCLGSEYAGLFSNDDKLSRQIYNAGEKVEEKVWRMPLHKNYDKLMNSKNADVQNINYVGGAGSTTAAQFLQRFILNKTPWAHLDIAGMAFSKYGGALNSGGATGFGVRLLNQLVEENYE